MSEWRKIWANGLPNEDRSPKSGPRMAAEGMPFPWRWNGGTNSTVLDGIWGMSAQSTPPSIIISPPDDISYQLPNIDTIVIKLSRRGLSLPAPLPDR